MGTVLACIGCYCCLLGVRPKFIELFALLANLVEIGFSIWGIVEIPWSDIPTGGKICFYITCGLMLITLILLIILMILRCNRTINTTRNSTAKCLCITACIFDVLAFIMVIISEIIILYKMYDLDDDRDYWRGRRSYRSGYFSNSEWAAAGISTTADEIGILCHFYCVSFLYKLIHLKTDKSFAEVNDNNTHVIGNSINDSDRITTTVEVVNTPPAVENNLAFLGYDKNGRPIYAGNQQYRVINVPVTNQPNTNQNNNNINNVTNNTDDTNNNIQ